MTALTNAPDFEAALADLQEHLPSWWRTRDPASNVYSILDAGATLLDQISALWQQPHNDLILSTASAQGLLRNFAFAWGLTNEQLPTVVSQLSAYIQARAAEDGTTQSLINTLTALVNNTANQGGPVLTFDAGGAGLTFPANGSGLVMYQWASQPLQALQFAADGTGLTFPANGSGLTFGTFAVANLLPNFSTYTETIQVLSYLSYDTSAFARAVARFRAADWLPTVIQTVPSF